MKQSLLRDNPVLVKHLRSRLRRQQLIPLMVVVIIVAACIVWGGFAPREYNQEDAISTSLFMLFCLQGIILFLAGSAQVAGTVAIAREQRILDFHRISPQRPLALSLGFLLGAPIREYILFACTLPFTIPYFAMGKAGTWGLGGVLLEMVIVALMYHAFALLLGLVAPKPRGIAALVVIFIFVLHILFALVAPAYFTIIPSALASVDFYHTPSPFQTALFGIPAPALLVSLLQQILLGVFLLIAATRKMRHERAYPFTRPVAVLFYFLLGVVVLSDSIPVVGEKHFDMPNIAIPIIVLYALLLLGLFLVSAVTPGLGDFLKGIRHAEKTGESRVSMWSDFAVNAVPLLACSVIVLAVGTAACLIAEALPVDQYSYHSTSTSDTYLACGVGALTLIYFGLAKQGFDLFFKKHSLTFLALSLFILWIVPMLVLMVAFMTDASGGFRDIMLGLSPITGIGATALSSQDGMSDMPRLIAVSMSVALTVISAIFYHIAVRRARAQAAITRKPVVPTPAA